MKRVRVTLTGLTNVDDVKIDFAGKTATVSMKKGNLTEDTICSALKKSGYGVTSFQEKGAKKRKKYVVAVTGMT